MQPLFHIVRRDDWPGSGEYRPASLTTEGFVHCSYADQVAGTMDRYYRGVADLVVVKLAADRVGTVRGENGFPHVYGPIPVTALVAVHDVAEFARG